MTDTSAAPDSGQQRVGRVQRPAVPVPRSLSDWHRYVKQERTLNDHVEELHKALFEEDPEYAPLFDAVYDEQATEGSLAADNLLAAMKIRALADRRNLREVTREKYATIVKALNVVLRRYHQSRKERRNRVGGETVPDNGE